MMGYAIAAWIALVLFTAVLILAARWAKRLHDSRTTPETQPLRLFVDEDLYERSIRESGIDPATVRVAIPAFQWPGRLALTPRLDEPIHGVRADAETDRWLAAINTSRKPAPARRHRMPRG